MEKEDKDPILKAKGITKKFGDLVALNGVDLTLHRGEFLGLIGPNGAGKTTFFNVITGFLKPEDGDIYYYKTGKKENITGIAPDKIASKGLARTFQIPRPLGKQSVLKNVLTAAYKRADSLAEARSIATDEVEFVGLENKTEIPAGDLNPVERKRCALAQALALKPRVLLLDEIVAGLNPKEVQEILNLLHTVHERVNSIIMVEHVMSAIMKIAERITVLDSGEILASGTPKEIQGNQKVIEAYLGTEEG